MAFSRRFSRGRGSRRSSHTAWAAYQTTFNPLAASSHETAVAFDPSPLLAVGNAPTVIRVRGELMIDPDFDPAGTGPTQWQCGARICVCETAPATWSATALEDEDIIWAGILGGSGNRFRTQLTAVGVETFGHITTNDREKIDTKAMRKLTEQDRVWFAITNLTTSQPIEFKYTVFLRILYKIPR